MFDERDIFERSNDEIRNREDEDNEKAGRVSEEILFNPTKREEQEPNKDDDGPITEPDPQPDWPGREDEDRAA